MGSMRGRVPLRQLIGRQSRHLSQGQGGRYGICCAAEGVLPGQLRETWMADSEERFCPLEGLPGKLFVPRPAPERKHACADCFACQWCSDSRCTACREERPRCRQSRPDTAVDT